MTKTETALQYRQKFGIEMPTKKLARIMYSDNPILFNDVEDARTFLRYIEGKNGRGSRKDNLNVPNRPANPYSLPKSHADKYEAFIMPYHKKVAILNDIHIPYHDNSALTITLDFLAYEEVDAVLLNGDILDFHTLSSFEKNPKKRKFSEEFEAFSDFMEVLKNTLDCTVYYKLGNHEERYSRFLHMKAHELVGVTEFDIESLIRNRVPYDINIIKDKRIVKINSLNVIHGHEYKGGISAPVNIARGLYLKGKVSACQGHNHTTSEHTETDMNGKIVTTWSIGCLCGLNPDYMPLNKWNHGFAIVEMDENGEDYHFKNYRIFNGKII